MRLTKLLLTTATLLTLAACAVDDVAEHANPKKDSDGYRIRLTLSAGSLNTRSEGHATEVGTADDAFINIAQDDYAIFIFDDAGQFVQRFEPGAVSLQQDANNKYKYVLNGALKPERALEKMQMMVLANERKDFRGNYFLFENAIASQTLSQIYANNTQFNFTMPVASNVSWTPTPDETGIPMFGLSEVIALDKEIVELTNEVPMLRALAKIEILDKVPDGKNANIERCVLTTYNTSGRFIPDVTNNPNWNGTDEYNTQIETPSLPDGVTTDTDLQFALTKRNVTIDGTSYEKDCFVAYLPEMALTDANRPEINVYVKGTARPYTIKLSGYEEGKPKEGEEYTSLLRNHLYRYNVLSVGVNTELTLYIETPVWDETPDQEWTYTDADATFAENGTFAWDTPQWDNSDMGDQYRILLVTDEEGAEGRFTLTGPQGGTWTISLFADDDTRNDHFRIDVWNGMEWQPYGDTATGNIDSREVRIRIIATAANGTAVDYTARMVMTVKTFDDRVANVKLTENAEYNPSNDTYYYVVKQLTNGGDNM